MTDYIPNVLLGGGGSAEQAKTLDDAFFAEVAGHGARTCLYVPNAMPSDRYDSCKSWFMDTYGSAFSRVEVAYEPGAILESGRTFDAIYIGGGHTGRLLEMLRKTGLDGYVERHSAEGRLLYGGSAGAIVLGETILTAPGHEHSTDYSAGMGIVPGIGVIAHFSGDDASNSRGVALAQQLGVRLWAIPEEAGILVDADGHAKAVGTTSCYEFVPGSASPSVLNETVATVARS